MDLTSAGATSGSCRPEEMRINARRLVVVMTLLLLDGFGGRVRDGPAGRATHGSIATVRQRWHLMSSSLLCDRVVVMRRDPLPVRERTRRAVRGELAQLAVSLFVEKGYDETTIDDLAAAAGMSKRTFF